MSVTVVVYTVPDCIVAVMVYVVSSLSSAGEPVIMPLDCSISPVGRAGVIA